MNQNIIIYPTLLALSILLFFSCQSEKENLLIGKWQAKKITEQDSTLDVNLEEIWFTFDAQNRYTFHSTLNYREAGKYERLNQLLYTTDTLNNDSQRKAVEILSLENNSLQLEMKDAGKKRVLELTRENALLE